MGATAAGGLGDPVGGIVAQPAAVSTIAPTTASDAVRAIRADAGRSPIRGRVGPSAGSSIVVILDDLMAWPGLIHERVEPSPIYARNGGSIKPAGVRPQPAGVRDGGGLAPGRF